MPYYLILDVGQTGCRAALFDDVGLIRSHEGRGQTHAHLFDGWYDMQVAMFQEPVRVVTQDVSSVDVICLGINLSRVRRDVASALDEALRSLIRTRRVIITSDVVIAYAGALGLAPGSVTIAGTGVVSLCANGKGQIAHCNGWGYLLGDQGGGFAIAQQGLANAMKEYDGRGGSERLRDLAERRFGPLDSLMSRLQSNMNHVKSIAEFAPDVAEAAIKGDAVAREIWSTAAKDLAATAVAPAKLLLPHDQEVVISWAGGLFEQQELLLCPFKDAVVALLPSSSLKPPKGAALQGGYVISTGPSSSFFGDALHTFYESDT